MPASQLSSCSFAHMMVHAYIYPIYGIRLLNQTTHIADSIIYPQKNIFPNGQGLQSITQNNPYTISQTINNPPHRQGQVMTAIFQYIFYKDNVVHLDHYFDYLKTIKDNQPAAISDFFCDERLYLLHDEYTLHDAWVEKLSLEHVYHHHLKSTAIEIILLLSSHKKKVRLQYLDVAGFYSGNTEIRFSNQPNDLYIHEFHVSENGNYMHTIEFRDNSYMVIEFKNFTHAFIDC